MPLLFSNENLPKPFVMWFSEKISVVFYVFCFTFLIEVFYPLVFVAGFEIATIFDVRRIEFLVKNQPLSSRI